MCGRGENVARVRGGLSYIRVLCCVLGGKGKTVAFYTTQREKSGVEIDVRATQTRKNYEVIPSLKLFKHLHTHTHIHRHNH